MANDGTTYSGNNSGATYSTGSSISGTEDDQLYRTERFGNNFSLNIPVINGSYQVTLMFAEIFHDAAGDRLFNVSIEGAEVISNLDIYSKAGKNAVYNETHEVTITDGEINIDFTTIVDNAKISAIKVVSNLFEGETYTLTTDDPDNGTIIANPADGSYPAGSNVSVTALPDSGFIFTGWSGDLTSTENPATLYMNGDKDLSAIFTETNWYTLTASATNGIISIDPGEGIYGYTEGTVVSLTAIPDEGYYFTGWSGDLSGMVNPATIVMDSDKEIAAEFLNPYALTISINSNNGSVQVMPEQEVYYRGASVFLMAIPDEGYEFVRWEGDLTGSDNPAGFVINRNLIITAVFNEVTGTRDVISDHSAKTILLQNYPNPFSNETTIQYELNKATHVKLTIYHVLGYHLATLVDEYQAAGSHSVTWHAKENKGEHLTNGFYIYRLETGSEVIHIKKASLMR